MLTVADIMTRTHKTFLKRLGFDDQHTLYSWKHTGVVQAYLAGVDIKSIQRQCRHSSIEMTRRYARLTDNTRREEYFRAMAIIEKGEPYGHYHRHPKLPPVPEEKELLGPYH